MAVGLQIHASRNTSVDSLRGVAIIMVLVLHAVAMTPRIEAYPWLLAIAHQFAFGVQLFFVLSGFVIAAAFERCEARGEGVSGFLSRRAAKMLPLYLLFLHANILFFVAVSRAYVDPTFFRNSVDADNLTWANYFVHVFFLQGFTSALLHTLQDGSWSIVCEVYFYLLYAIVLNRLSRTLAASMWLFVGSLAISVAFTMTVGRYTGDYGYYAFPIQLPTFLLGVYCYRVREQCPNLMLSGRHKYAFGIALAAVFLGYSKLKAAPLGPPVFVSILFALALLLIPWQSNNALARALVSFGRQSYALFLLHIFLLKAFYTLVVAESPNAGLPMLVVANLITALGVSWVLSWAVFDRIDMFCVRSVAHRIQRKKNLDLSKHAG